MKEIQLFETESGVRFKDKNICSVCDRLEKLGAIYIDGVNRQGASFIGYIADNDINILYVDVTDERKIDEVIHVLEEPWRMDVYNSYDFKKSTGCIIRLNWYDCYAHLDNASDYKEKINQTIDSLKVLYNKIN